MGEGWVGCSQAKGLSVVLQQGVCIKFVGLLFGRGLAFTEWFCLIVCLVKRQSQSGDTPNLLTIRPMEHIRSVKNWPSPWPPSGKASASRESDLNSIPAFAVGFLSVLSHNNDLRTGTPVATLPGVWCCGTSTGSGWPVSVLCEWVT